MNGIWAVPNKSWKRNETKAEWKRIGANHRLLTWFRGGNQYRASQNIDVTDPKDPEGNPKRIPRGPKTNYCLKTIHMRRKSNNEADNICCPISISCHTYVIWPFYQCAVQIHSTPVKNIFFLFFYLLCKPADLIFLRYLNIYIFQNILIGV